MTFQNAQDCPQCGQRNDTDMAFCIHCGQSMKIQGAGSDQVVSQNMPAQVESQPAAVICPACGQADSLNSQFCIFCGAKMIQTSGGQERRILSGGQSLTADSFAQPLPQPPAPVPAEGEAPGGFLMILGGIILGVAVGWIVASATRGTLEKTVVASKWPSEGLVVYASPPEAVVYVEADDHREILVGHTGPAGSLAFSNLPPGNYTVTVSAPGRESISKEVVVAQNSPTVLGYPERIDLPAGNSTVR